MNARDDAAPKIGAGHASAMFRQGLRELRGAMYPESNVAQHAEYGLYGTKTPGEVAESRRSDERDVDVSRWEQEGGSVVADRLRVADAARDERPTEDRSIDRE